MVPNFKNEGPNASLFAKTKRFVTIFTLLTMSNRLRAGTVLIFPLAVRPSGHHLSIK